MTALAARFSITSRHCAASTRLMMVHSASAFVTCVITAISIASPSSTTTTSAFLTTRSVLTNAGSTRTRTTASTGTVVATTTAVGFADIRCRRGFHNSMSSSSSSDNSNTSSSSSSTEGGTGTDGPPIVSRLSTLQSLLSLRGAPGSTGCRRRDNDLVPVDMSSSSTWLDLHPHLYPISQSRSTGHFVCAYRTPYDNDDDADDDSNYNGNAPSTGKTCPIVESGIGFPGMKLIAPNSEYLMRRIAAEADDDGDNEAIEIYNNGLGEGSLADIGLDQLYEPGSVKKLGYGLTKYVLLRVGPFPDLYEEMALSHASRGDEPSSLIAAETANGKFTGFGSTFASYARILDGFPNREDEARDAARVCLRLPLSTCAMTRTELTEVARSARLATAEDDEYSALAKLRQFYEKIRAHEEEQERQAESSSPSGKTIQQMALDEAVYLLDTVAMDTDMDGGSEIKKKWREIRSSLAEIYTRAGKKDMAAFVNPLPDDLGP